MNCAICHQDRTIKKGKRNGRQRYYCRVCNKSFQGSYSYRAYCDGIDAMLVKLLKEGCGVRGISRILNIACGTVLSRILKLARQIKRPFFNETGRKFEVDELFVKIANGRSQNYITYALERETKSVIDFAVGSRSIENIGPIIDCILLSRPQKIYTDKLNVYPNLIPEGIHRVFKYCTNKIERHNLTLRTHIKRLSRRTICFSKSQKHLEAHLRIYFWG